METSQAVSMLQPFRHPKPGLIIMNKAEEGKLNYYLDKYIGLDWLRSKYSGHISSIKHMLAEYGRNMAKDAYLEGVANTLNITDADIIKFQSLVGDVNKMFYKYWKSKQE